MTLFERRQVRDMIDALRLLRGHIKERGGPTDKARKKTEHERRLLYKAIENLEHLLAIQTTKTKIKGTSC